MASAPDPVFDALVSAGPIVDNAGHLTVIGQLEYDGPRCDAADCTTAVDDDGDRCDDCTPCTSCRGAGGWQQPDGLIIECPRGCMTDDRRPAAARVQMHVGEDGVCEPDCPTCEGLCPECRAEVSKPGLCFDCDVRASYVGGLAPRFGAQP